MDAILENWYHIFALVVLLIPIGYIISYKRTRREIEKSADLLEENDPFHGDAPPLEEIHGRILEKHCFSGVAGTKTPRAYRTFYIILMSDEGEKLRYEVDEECYLSVKEGQWGTVAVVGSRFYGFCPDETVIDP